MNRNVNIFVLAASFCLLFVLPAGAQQSFQIKAKVSGNCIHMAFTDFPIRHNVVRMDPCQVNTEFLADTQSSPSFIRYKVTFESFRCLHAELPAIISQLRLPLTITNNDCGAGLSSWFFGGAGGDFSQIVLSTDALTFGACLQERGEDVVMDQCLGQDNQKWTQVFNPQ
jgi:hypothetical protein